MFLVTLKYRNSAVIVLNLNLKINLKPFVIINKTKKIAYLPLK